MKALSRALIAANQSLNVEDRFVEIPSGIELSMHQIDVNNLVDVTIKLNGNVYATQNWIDWPVGHHFWNFTDCDGLKIEG